MEVVLSNDKEAKAGPSKRRRTRRLYSPPPMQIRRQTTASKPPGAIQPASLNKLHSSQPQQLETSGGSAVGENIFEASLSALNVNNKSMFNEFMPINTVNAAADVYAGNTEATATSSYSMLSERLAIGPVIERETGDVCEGGTNVRSIRLFFRKEYPLHIMT